MVNSFVRIPAGCYEIGITKSQARSFGLSEQDVPSFGITQHDCVGLEIQSHPVTNHVFASYWQRTFSEPYLYDPALANLPVVGVTVAEAIAFASAHGYRLPTCAEWEIAARGPHSSAFPWGDALDIPHTSMKCHELFESRKHLFKIVDPDGVVPAMPEIGLFPEFNSAFGVCDLVGFVSELTNSQFDGWIISKGHPFNAMRSPFHMAQARWYRPEVRYFNIGFRCARNVV